MLRRLKGQRVWVLAPGAMEVVVIERGIGGGVGTAWLSTTWLVRRHHVDLCQTSTALCLA
jgi:hypothetical protein